MEDLLWQFGPFALTVLVPVVYVAVAIIAKRAATKVGLSIEQADILEGLLDAVVAKGVIYAEQIDSQKAAEGREIHGSEKLFVAIDFIVTALSTLGVGAIAREALIARVEAALGQAKAEGLIA